MTTPVDSWFARISKETIIRNPSTPWALTWADISYDSVTTLNEKIDSLVVWGWGNSLIQFKDEGVDLGTTWTVSWVDFVWAWVTASRVWNNVTVTIPWGWAWTWDMLKSENLSGLANYTTARSNLGMQNVLPLLSTALTSACSMTLGTPTSKFNIPAFTAVFVDNYTTPWTPVITQLSYAGSANNTVTNLATQDITYISMDKVGTIFQTVALVDADLLRDRVIIWALWHSSRTAIDQIDVFSTTNGYDVAAALADISGAIGIINNGNLFSGNGANLLINKSVGTQTQVWQNFWNSFKNPNILTCASLTWPSVYQTWRNGAGGWVTNVATALVPWKYDNNTAGGVTSPNWVLAVNKWQLIKVYYLGSLNLVGYEYGQVVYNSEAEAEWAKSAATTTNPLFAGLSFRWWIVVRWGATNLSITSDAIFLDSGKFGSVTGWTGSGSSTTTMQQSYDNSTTPQITTTTALGAVDLKRGSAADTDNVVRVLNGAGTATASIDGNGKALVSSIELWHATDTTISRVSAGVIAVEGVTVPTISSTSTITNKRITKRVVVTTQAATPAINTDNGDIFQITGLAQAITSMTTNLTGTPVAGDMMMIQITDNATARAITWGASFASTTVTLPTTTVISTMLRVGFQRNNANTIWDCIAIA